MSKTRRSELIRKQIKSDKTAPDIKLADEDLDRILNVVPDSSGEFPPISKEEFRLAMEGCLRGFVVCPKWESTLRWNSGNLARLNRLRGAAIELNNAASALDEADAHLLRYIRRYARFTKETTIEYSNAMVEEFARACDLAPLPDHGPQTNIPLRFLASELGKIWAARTGEEPRRSDRKRTAGSEEGEFGLIVVRVLEIMAEKKLLPIQADQSHLLKQILARIDRTKARRVL